MKPTKIKKVSVVVGRPKRWPWIMLGFLLALCSVSGAATWAMKEYFPQACTNRTVFVDMAGDYVESYDMGGIFKMEGLIPVCHRRQLAMSYATVRPSFDKRKKRDILEGK